MGRSVDILIAISEKHLHYSLFVKRIIAIEAWSDYSYVLEHVSDVTLSEKKWIISVTASPK